MSTYLTTGQVARLFRVSARTAAKWCDQGRLRHHRLPIGRKRRISVAEVRRFAAEYQVPIDDGFLSRITSDEAAADTTQSPT